MDENISKDVMLNLKTEIIAWRDAMLSAVQQNFQNDGEVMPVMLALELVDGKIQGLSAPLFADDDDERDVLASTLRKVCGTKNIIAVMFITEAWIAHVKTQDMYKYAPSAHPNRVEVVSVMFETKLNSQSFIFEINRSGPMPFLIPDPRNGMEVKFGGRFGNMLKMNVSIN